MCSLKVTQLVSPAGFYGAERWIVTLGRSLAEVDVESELLIIGDRPEQTAQLVQAWESLGLPAKLIREEVRFDPRSVWRTARHLKLSGCEILHTHGYKSDVIGLLAARIARIPIVVTPHGFGIEKRLQQLLYMKLGLWAARRADAVAPLSWPLRETMHHFGVSEQKLHLIPNAVDLHELDAAVSALPDQQTTATKSIVYIGRLVSGKRVQHFIDIACALRNADMPVRIDIVGEGTERPILEARIKKERLEDSVQLHGFRSDRLRIVAEADLFVLPSASEGTPRSMMEAMALGTPVVAYDIPGVLPLINDGVTGRIAPDGDIAALCSICRCVLSDDALAARLVKAARLHVRTEFSGTRLAADYGKLYRSLELK